MWITSTMMDNEWNDDPDERRFIQSNFDVVNRGVFMERIFIFNDDKINEYKKNPYLQRYLANDKIKCYYVNQKELIKKNPKLLDIISNGWIGIDDYALLVDLPSDGTSRGYVTMNKKEIKKCQECFKELKTHAVLLNKILK